MAEKASEFGSLVYPRLRAIKPQGYFQVMRSIPLFPRQRGCVHFTVWTHPLAAYTFSLWPFSLWPFQLHTSASQCSFSPWVCGRLNLGPIPSSFPRSHNSVSLKMPSKSYKVTKWGSSCSVPPARGTAVSSNLDWDCESCRLVLRLGFPGFSHWDAWLTIWVRLVLPLWLPERHISWVEFTSIPFLPMDIQLS